MVGRLGEADVGTSVSYKPVRCTYVVISFLEPSGLFMASFSKEEGIGDLMVLEWLSIATTTRALFFTETSCDPVFVMDFKIRITVQMSAIPTFGWSHFISVDTNSLQHSSLFYR